MFDLSDRTARAIALVVAALILRDVPGKFGYLAHAITEMAGSFDTFIRWGKVADE